MKYIAIIAAMEQEMMAIRNIMKDITKIDVFDKTIFLGKISDKDCLLVQCGVGKVNAARITQLIIDKFEVSNIINVGCAGATESSLKVLDVVISSGLVQHDFDITAFDHEKGYITDIGKIIKADSRLVDIFDSLIDDEDGKVYKALIATGDIFCSNKEIKSKIFDEFGASCVDMEGAAIGQVCYLAKIPFVVIRSISDSLDSEASIDFYKFLELASNRCAKFLESAIKII